jgi:hypothetical protein
MPCNAAVRAWCMRASNLTCTAALLRHTVHAMPRCSATCVRWCCCLLACLPACLVHIAALLAGCPSIQLWLGSIYPTAEAAACARDRAVLALRRAGLRVPGRLNFPEADYQREDLLQLSGTAVTAIRCLLLLQSMVVAALARLVNDNDE